MTFLSNQQGPATAPVVAALQLSDRNGYSPLLPPPGSFSLCLLL